MHRECSHHVGIDLGGTKIEAIVIDSDKKELIRKRVPTEAHKGYDALLQNIINLYRDVIKQLKLTDDNVSLGIGMPGVLKKETRRMINSNTVVLNGKPFQEDLTKHLRKKFYLENDANCFALAEAVVGAGTNADMVFGVILGTGCGGGIIYHKKIWRGHQHIAGEWGHMSIDNNPIRHYNCVSGSVEMYLSGGGCSFYYEKLYDEKLMFSEIIERYYQGDKKATDFMKNYFHAFGKGIANVINILDPDLIVIGGGLSNYSELYTVGVEHVKQYAFIDKLATPIVKNQLGDSAGVYGAAFLGKELGKENTP